MKKILYLHGLESKQGGPKVDFLEKEFYVCAPDMNYKDPMLQKWIDFMVCEFNPDIIIGSSMGGYVADILSKKYNTPAILFNPALHNRGFEPAIEYPIESKQTELQEKKIVVLGKQDEVIPPYITKIMLENNPYYEIVLEEMGHQVPLSVFIDTINKYKNEL
jgi:uncharacterized protein